VITLRSPRVRLQKMPGGFRREVRRQRRVSHSEPAFCSVSKGQRRLGEKENREVQDPEPTQTDIPRKRKAARRKYSALVTGLQHSADDVGPTPWSTPDV
jgi:hypothetical protein